MCTTVLLDYGHRLHLKKNNSVLKPGFFFRLRIKRTHSFIHSHALIVQDGPLTSHFDVSWSHIQTHGRTPLDEWSARRRDLYLHRTTQHINTTNIHTPSGIWTRDPSNKRPQIYALDRADTGIGMKREQKTKNVSVGPRGLANMKHSSAMTSLQQIDLLSSVLFLPEDGSSIKLSKCFN
jgi:hypothetical protein